MTNRKISETPVFNFSHFFPRECFENSWAGFLWCFILHCFITLHSLFSSPFAVRTTGCTWKCWGMQEHTSTPSPADSDRSEGLDGDGWFGDRHWISRVIRWWSCFLFVGFFFLKCRTAEMSAPEAHISSVCSSFYSVPSHNTHLRRRLPDVGVFGARADHIDEYGLRSSGL